MMTEAWDPFISAARSHHKAVGRKQDSPGLKIARDELTKMRHSRQAMLRGELTIEALKLHNSSGDVGAASSLERSSGNPAIAKITRGPSGDPREVTGILQFIFSTVATLYPTAPNTYG